MTSSTFFLIWNYYMFVMYVDKFYIQWFVAYYGFLNIYIFIYLYIYLYMSKGINEYIPHRQVQ